MPDYFNLKKAAKSINKDYKYMETHTPVMNQSISEYNRSLGYDPRQSVKDAAYDAKKKFGDRTKAHEKVFLWTEKKDVQLKMEKYTAFSDKSNQELKDYSVRFTNHSARKRAASSANARESYRKYNLKMQQLSEMSERLDALDNINTKESIKEIKSFFEQSMAALSTREDAMKAAAEVKSTSGADETFRKIKITRMILSQKLKLAEKYRDKYRENRELGAYFEKQCDKLQDKMVMCLSKYESAYLAVRGHVDRLKLEEVVPGDDEQVENEHEPIDVINDTTTINPRVDYIVDQFGAVGTDEWRNRLKEVQEGQSNVCKNDNISSVRTALDEISQQQNNKYEDQLNRISDFARSAGRTVSLRKHSSKGHSYTRNGEHVFRFDLLGTGDAPKFELKHIPNTVRNFINNLEVEFLVGEANTERKAYFYWLKEIRHHESMEDIVLNDDAYDMEFLNRQHEIAKNNKQLVVDYFSYKIYGRNSAEPALGRINDGVRVRQAERNVPLARRELRENQKRELITIKGCEWSLGFGKYSIEAVAEYMKELAKSRLIPLFDKWTSGEEAPKTIHFMLDGLSRGGVNASLGAMSINGWIANEYPHYLKFVKYDLIQREPVPGPSVAALKDSVRIGGAARDQVLDENGFIKGTKYKPLSQTSTNSTVFYSIHPNVGVFSPFFQPQRVYGANRIILSPFSHNDDGKTPGVFHEVFNSGNKSRAMLNNTNGEFYAGSGVSDLEDGVYVLDEYSTLTKINSYEDAELIFNKTRDDKIYSKRRARILDVVKVWFTEHQNQQEGEE